MTHGQIDQLVEQLRFRAQHWRFRAEMDDGLADALSTHVHLVSEGFLGVPEVEEMAAALWAAVDARTDVSA